MKKLKLIKLNTDSLKRASTILESLYKFELTDNHHLKLTDIKRAYEYMINFQESQGPDRLMKLVKTSRQMVLSYLAKQEIIQDSSMWIKTDRNRLPSWLGSLKDPKVLDTPELCRFTLTVVFTTRWLSFEGTPDFSPIRDSGEVSISPDFKAFLRSESNPLSYLTNVYTANKIEFYPSTKAGPNGPALLSSMIDIKALPPQYKSKLLNIISKIDDYWEGKETLNLVIPDEALYVQSIDDQEDFASFSDFTYDSSKSDSDNDSDKESIASHPEVDRMEEMKAKQEFKDPITLRHRKVEVIPDKEGKQRIIAIVDYWTQVIFKSIHKSLNKVLGSIKEDCTFNQNNFKTLLRYFGEETFYSIDLKAATELMPANWQAEVLSWLTDDEEFGLLWKSILCDDEFPVKGHPPLKYNRGQPMGVYSSWPMMAITHHLLLAWAASRKGISLKRYALLGDDLLIVGDDLFLAYKEVIDLCQMKLNVAKTFKSKEMFEFAKRFYLKGHEISPFPVGAVLSANGDIPTVAVAIDNAFAKSWLTRYSDKRLRKLFLKTLIRPDGSDVPYRFVRNLEDLIFVTEAFRFASQKTDTALQHLTAKDNGDWSLNCNHKEDTIRKQMREYFLYLLFVSANKKTFEYLQSVTAVQMHLMASQLFRTMPNLFDVHPALKLAQNFNTKFGVFQNVVLDSIRNQKFGELELEELLLTQTDPLPSLEALYREQKRSVRKVVALGQLSKTFKHLMRSEYQNTYPIVGTIEGVLGFTN